ncbi:MAG: type II toxin-antitoxin system death-on-curing family toxin [Deltaproteobacteria bacterium]|nr:MAG: type II toxin-antitoxin system death-on-curing family toxin [Deltaproteobacteria bacterium]
MAKKRRREPAWVDRLVIDAVHLDLLREHGGLAGLRDENALESALARPKNRWNYEVGVDIATLAAAYGWGLATGHPYRDGNKRVAFVTMATFVALNGYELEAPDEEVVQAMMSVAARHRSEHDLADWVRAHLVRRRAS